MDATTPIEKPATQLMLATNDTPRPKAQWRRIFLDKLAETSEARIALVASSLVEARAVMVEGERGLLNVCHGQERPTFEPSLRRLTWPNGAQATLYSAAEPESLRGPQNSHAWCTGAEGVLYQRSARADRRNAASGYRRGSEHPTNCTPQDGQNWIVGSAPVGAWAGQAGKLACRQSGNWLFAAPTSGMRVYEVATGQQLLFDGTWQRAAAVTTPTGGTTVDTQARAAIAGLISALVAAGILA